VLELFGCSDWLLGQKGKVPVVLSLIPVSSILVVLAVLLLLLRELSLEWLLMLTLMLMLVSLRVTLFELLGWIA
jgi:hypothetical protein